MAEFDKAWDSIGQISDNLHDKLKEVLGFPGNEYNFPGWVQALEICDQIVIPCDFYSVDPEFIDLLQIIANTSTVNKYDFGFPTMKVWTKKTTKKLNDYIRKSKK